MYAIHKRCRDSTSALMELLLKVHLILRCTSKLVKSNHHIAVTTVQIPTLMFRTFGNVFILRSSLFRETKTPNPLPPQQPVPKFLFPPFWRHQCSWKVSQLWLQKHWYTWTRRYPEPSHSQTGSSLHTVTIQKKTVRSREMQMRRTSRTNLIEIGVTTIVNNLDSNVGTVLDARYITGR